MNLDRSTTPAEGGAGVSPAIVAACRAGLGATPPEVAPDEPGARALIEWLVARVTRRRFSPEDIRAGYCSRSPREVIAQASVPFTAPCADLSGVAAHLLAWRGIPVTLVLGGIARLFRPVKFQSGLELDIAGETWVAGFGVARAVLYKGRFEPTRRRPWLFRRRPVTLDLDRPFLGYFDEAAREGLGRVVPGYDLERDLRDHVARSGALAFRLARRKAQAVLPPPHIAAASCWEAA
jgi:hypothetical protein